MGQTIIWGAEGLPLVLRQYRKALLVLGIPIKGSMVEKSLDTIQHCVFDGFTSNPLYEDICRGIELFQKEQCDAIVAIGGGSAIDVAKCIKLFSKMDPEANYLEQEKKDSGIPLIAIPTTAGTGSESTRHAVTYFQGNKQSIAHESIVPNYAVLIPEMLKGLPLYQKKCTMLDALCQAIESWWSVNSTEESRMYAKQAVLEIRDNWQAYIEENALCAAERMMDAANLAGRAINITATTAPHAMSYKITSMYGLPHGHAVAVCLPVVWAYMQSHIEECVDLRGKDYFCQVLDSINETVNLAWYKRLMEKLCMANPCAKEREPELDILSVSVNPTRLKNSPIAFDSKTLRGFYERILM